MTEKQRQLKVRKRMLISFRRYVSLQGDGSAVTDYINMNAFELRNYIEGYWQTGMDWKNYRKEWVVDHIVPIRYFDAFNLKEMKLCWSYHNLRPSWFSDNHAKGCNPETAELMLMTMEPSITRNMLLSKLNGDVYMFEPYYNAENIQL